MKSPSYYITTLGCPKNQADSREMERSLSQEGYIRTDSADQADVHLINSCAFIEDARVETIRTVLDAGKVKKKHKKQKLVLVGCFTERYADTVRAELPEIDFSFGTGIYHKAGELIRNAFGLSVGLEPVSPFFEMQAQGKPYAPVKISDGCDRGCSFCAIPLFRGKFRDIPADEIIAECERLAAQGVREVFLVSQDSNSYGGKPEAYLDLVERIHEVEGLHWIRMLYMYPDGKTERILEGMRTRSMPKVVPYLESPVQHASESVLRAMRRIGSSERFADLFALARDVMPGCEVRTSILLGFPGETDADVEKVEQFIATAKPEKLALFSYSPEEGTPGAEMSAQIAPEIIADRIRRVQGVHRSVQSEHLRSLVGTTFQCMVDESSAEEVVLRRPQDAPEADGVVYAEPKSRLLHSGDLVNVEITGFTEYDLTGVIT